MNKRMSLIGCILIGVCPALFPQGALDHFILGAQEGEGMLVSPRRAREGPDGHIYVYDAGDAFIKVFSPEGKYLRRIGGKGQGPGEIQRPDGADFGFTPDGGLYFTEFFGGHPWLTIMDISGGLVKTLHLGINQVFGVNRSCPLKDGGYLLDISFGSRPEMKKDYFLYRYPRVLARIDAEGEIASEIVRANNFESISSIGDGADQWLPFVPAFAWTVIKDASVAFSDGLSPNLSVYDLGGEPIGVIETPLPGPDKVRGRDLDEWRKQRAEAISDKAWFNRFGRVIEKYRASVHDKKPILDGISATPGGHLLVSGAGRPAGKAKYWLLSQDGKALATIELAGANLSISKSFLFFVALDREENERIVCLRRIGDEIKDLLRAQDLKSLE